MRRSLLAPAAAVDGGQLPQHFTLDTLAKSDPDNSASDAANGGGVVVNSTGERLVDDCTLCRLLSGCGLLGASWYVYTGVPNQHPRARSAVFLLAVGLAYTGLARLGQWPPFERKTRHSQGSNRHHRDHNDYRNR